MGPGFGEAVGRKIVDLLLALVVGALAIGLGCGWMAAVVCS